MKQLFLFGAGASFGSGPCHPTAPALGKDLIHALVPPSSHSDVHGQRRVLSLGWACVLALRGVPAYEPEVTLQH